MGFQSMCENPQTGHAGTATWYGETRLGSRAAEFSVTSECRTYGALIIHHRYPSPSGLGSHLGGRPSGPRRIIGWHIPSLPHTWQPVKRSRKKANLDQSGSRAKDGAWELRSPTMTTTLYRNLGDGGQDVSEAADWPRFERVAAPTLQ
jgi:hypothetical protein